MSTTNTSPMVLPYLFFHGRCEEALQFYGNALGAKVDMLMRFKESPEPHQPGVCPPGWENKVMHASFHIGETAVMASDGQCGGQASFVGFSMAISVPAEDEARRMFAALAEGGSVRMPMAKTFFSPCFGVVEDRFGVSWMVMVAQR